MKTVQRIRSLLLCKTHPCTTNARCGKVSSCSLRSHLTRARTRPLAHQQCGSEYEPVACASASLVAGEVDAKVMGGKKEVTLKTGIDASTIKVSDSVKLEVLVALVQREHQL